jgi:NitT/TauT family transport system permease protein
MRGRYIRHHDPHGRPWGFERSLSRAAYAYAHIVVPVVLIGLVALAVAFMGEAGFGESKEHVFTTISVGLIFTLIRLVAAYALSVALAIPMALAVDRSPTLMRIFLPVYDTLQSVPYLIFLPVIVVIAAHAGFLEGAALFVLVSGMVWPLVFSLITGLRVIPAEIKLAARIFGAHGWQQFAHVTLPAVTPYLITGSLLSWGAGWDMVVVAEVLHTYAPATMQVPDVLGIGSLLISSQATGDGLMFMVSLCAVVAAVLVINFFVWQRLLTYAERFRFE